MNILKRFLIKLYEEDEYDKLNRIITIRKDEEHNGYYFHNGFHLTNDFAYAGLLFIDVNSYRSIIYNKCAVTYNYNKTGTFFEDEADAIKRKRMLIILLLNQYGTARGVISGMQNFMNRSRYV